MENLFNENDKINENLNKILSHYKHGESDISMLNGEEYEDLSDDDLKSLEAYEDCDNSTRKRTR